MAKPAAAEAPAKTKKEKVVEPPTIGTKEVADQIGCKPAALRRYLRSLPAYQDEGYTRYKWNPEDPKDARKVADLVAGYEKFKKAESEKNKERIEKLKKEQGAKGGKTAKGKKAPKEEDEEEDEEEELD